jgi:acyl-CoA-binding protein
LVARAEFNAWSALKGTSTTDAMQNYIKLVEDLQR